MTVAGTAGLTAEVRWVHVSELTDIAHRPARRRTRADHGVMLPEAAAGLTAYVDTLADVGAAGLVVELGRRYPDRLPRPLLRAADRRGLPLVALAHEVRFVA